MKEDVTLVIRLSAPGDVAMTLPVIRSVVSDGQKVVLLTRGFASGFFENIDGLIVRKADTDLAHKGLFGLIRLSGELRKAYNVRNVVDLHNVLRSRVLSFLFRLWGVKVTRIDKGRREKRMLVNGKTGMQLKHSIDRYIDVFEGAGFRNIKPVIPAFMLTASEESKADRILTSFLAGKSGQFIGVAPFSRHRMKTWGTAKIVSLLKLLGNNRSSHFILFGSREEMAGLREIASKVQNAHISDAGNDIRIELALISRLSYMISMDSLNMHLSSLSAVKTVSIWGGTHPYAGFYAYNQDRDLSFGISPDYLECRPCSVYGSGKCIRKDVKYKCLSDLSPEAVYQGIKEAGLFG